MASRIAHAALSRVPPRSSALRVACWARPHGRRQRQSTAAAAPAPASGSGDLFGDAHMELRRSLLKIIETEINPYADQWEEDGIFPAHDVFKKLGSAGFLGVTKPEQFGGLGLDYSYGLCAAETLGSIHAGAISMAIGVQTDMATPALSKFGSDEVRRNFLAPSIAGDAVACLGVSEASAGSDVAAIKTTAVRDGDDYVINGSKMWTTNGTQADWMCMLANTGGGSIHTNKSIICVPMDAKGIEVAPRFKKLGMHSSDTTQVFFDNVRVPVANLVGEEGKGFTYQAIQFQEERLFAAASVLIALEGCVERTIEYAGERKAFGKSILDNQAVQFRLAELQTEIEALRALVYRAGSMYVAGNDVTLLASMAKLKVGRLSREVTDACLQYWGGMGFMHENFVSRAYRDMRLISIGGGADEVMLQIICKLMGTMPKGK